MNKFNLCLFFIICLTNVGYTQIQYNDDGQIQNTEILIEKNKKIIYPEKIRFFENAILNKNREFILEPQIYNFKTVVSDIPELESKFRILSVKEEDQQKYYSNYMKVGLGNYFTTLAEGAVTTKINKDYQFGVFAKHLASMFGPTRFKENSGNASNYIQGFAKVNIKRNVINGSVDFERREVSFYGYKENVPKSNKDIFQAYNIFSAKLSAQNIDTNSKLKYLVKTEFYNLTNRLQVIENELIIDVQASYNINDFSKIRLHTSLSQSNLKDSLNQNRTLFNIKPLYEYLLSDKIKLNAGINVASENDTVKSGTIKNFHLYPIIKVDYQLSNKLNAYVGLDGGMEKNTLRTLVNQNPWIKSNIPLVHTNKTWELYGGLQGNITNYLHFKTSPSYANYRYMNFFINDSRDSAKFSVLYDTKGTNLFKFENELVFEKSQNFKLGLKSDVFIYSTLSILKPWHKPSFETTFWINFNLYQKLYFYADIMYISGIMGNNAQNINSENYFQLREIIDLTLKVEYKISDKFVIFIYGYNLAGQNYMRFNNYAVRGVNVVGGLSFNF